MFEIFMDARQMPRKFRSIEEKNWTARDSFDLKWRFLLLRMDVTVRQYRETHQQRLIFDAKNIVPSLMFDVNITDAPVTGYEGAREVVVVCFIRTSYVHHLDQT